MYLSFIRLYMFVCYYLIIYLFIYLSIYLVSYLFIYLYLYHWYGCERTGPWVHDDVIKWKHFSRNWPFVRGIHRSPVNSPHKGQWRWAFMFSLIRAWINGWLNNGEAGDLRRHRAHYDVIVMSKEPRLTLQLIPLNGCFSIDSFVCLIWTSEWAIILI